MRINGKRVYSNEEIRQMAMIGLDTDFIAYLQTAPDRVKNIVENMLPDEHTKSKLKATYDKKAVRGYHEEKNFESEEILNSDEKKIVSENTDNVLGDEDKQNNPYCGLDFSKRLELDELRVEITNDDECHLHRRPYSKIQVVLLYGGGGSYLNCCPFCKKLFMKEEEFKELETKLKEKNIKYVVD